MANTKRKITAGRVILEIVIFLALLLLGAYLMLYRPSGSDIEDPAPSADRLCAGVEESVKSKLPATQGDGALIRDAARDAFTLSVADVERTGTRKAAVTVDVRILDREKTFSPVQEYVNAALFEIVDSATARAEVYDADGSYNAATLDSAFKTALAACIAEPQYSSEQRSFRLSYKDEWLAPETEGLEAELAALVLAGDPADYADELLAECSAGAEKYSLRFRIDETALSAPAPNPDRFGSTDDPAVVQALLETDEAKRLIGDETVVWSSDIQRIPGTQIHYYLDETILTIVWQEVANRGVGTFSEVFVADGSQLRRKIDGDAYGSMEFRTTTQYAQETNAVLALGGDFYNHDRACGIVVYQRQIYRFEPDSCDTCFITADGDMLFAYRGQFQTQEEAQRYVDENDVLFSLCFGPVLIDNGEDVTPEEYRWGEIKDEYARSVLGMFGKGHYMTVNMNCQLPNYYYLSTLRAAADEVVKRGCQKAYTLDGGQTATTVFNYQLINPVQFGWEKTISDAIYFATALPDGQ